MTRRRRDRLRVRAGRATLRWRAAWPPSLQPPTPPPATEGRQPGPPAWVGIGAPRCGTTWWARQLASHPQVPMGSKELHFFDDYWTRPFGPADEAAYHRQFPRRDGERPGEWTPGYLYQPWAPQLLHQTAPEAHLLVLLRDPVDQLVSSINYSHLRHGAPANPLMVTRHLGEAAYHRHLRHWATTTGQPLLVLQFERCVQEPESQLARTFAFLGLEAGSVTPRVRPTNANASAPLTLTDPARRAIAEWLADDVRGLAEDFPDVDPGRWTSFRDL